MVLLTYITCRQHASTKSNTKTNGTGKQAGGEHTLVDINGMHDISSESTATSWIRACSTNANDGTLIYSTRRKQQQGGGGGIG